MKDEPSGRSLRIIWGRYSPRPDPALRHPAAYIIWRWTEPHEQKSPEEDGQGSRCVFPGRGAGFRGHSPRPGGGQVRPISRSSGTRLRDEGTGFGPPGTGQDPSSCPERGRAGTHRGRDRSFPTSISRAIVSASTPSLSSATGAIAAICIATCLATSSIPSTSVLFRPRIAARRLPKWL